jgi:hypothetical protein
VAPTLIWTVNSIIEIMPQCDSAQRREFRPLQLEAAGRFARGDSIGEITWACGVTQGPPGGAAGVAIWQNEALKSKDAGVHQRASSDKLTSVTG